MIVCKNCRTEAKEAHRFCKTCGKELSGENREVLEEKVIQGTPVIKMDNSSVTTKPPMDYVFILRNLLKKYKLQVCGAVAVLVLILGFFAVGNYLASGERVISKFEHALKEKNAKLLVSVLIEEEGEIKVTEESVKPILAYAEKNPQWIDETVKSLREDYELLKDPVRWEQEKPYTKYKDYVFIEDRVNKGLFPKYEVLASLFYCRVSVGVADAKLYCNGKELLSEHGFMDVEEIGPFLPGLYQMEARANGKYGIQKKTMEGIFIGNDGTVQMDFGLRESSVAVYGNYDDARVLVNGKESGFTVATAGEVGPVDANTKIQLVKDFPWGTMKSEEQVIGNASSITLQINGIPDELKEVLMQTVNRYNLSRIEAVKKQDIKLLTDASTEMVDRVRQDIEAKKAVNIGFNGVLKKISVDLDSFDISQNTVRFKITRSMEGGYVAKEKMGTEVIPPSEIAYSFSLIYDLQGKRWLVDDVTEDYYMSTLRTREFTF